MPDISMCANYTCPLRKKCYRYRAFPTAGYQTYADFVPVRDEANGFACEAFWEAKGRKLVDFETAETMNKKLSLSWSKQNEEM